MPSPSVTLVIPGRNCEKTLDRCLQSVCPLLKAGQLHEILFVDDGSTDGTNQIASKYPVTVLTGKGQGPGAARNLGWQAAGSDLIWFIDSDCVAEPVALEKLLPHMTDAAVAGAGGSYSNLFPDSLIASLIHEEIVARHRRMESDVNFLATFNVVYRRDVLQKVGGFDESLKLAQDAELAFRIVAAGNRLRFEIDSRVGHHHPRNFRRYLRTQCRQGFYRMMLYRNHPEKMSGDSYAGLMDYAQPPLAALALISLPTMVTATGRITFLILSAILLFLLLPMTCSLVAQSGPRMIHFLWFGLIRAIARAFGLVAGAIELVRHVLRSRAGWRAMERVQ